MKSIQKNTFPKISISEGVNSYGNPYVLKRYMDKQLKHNEYGNPVDVTVLKSYYTSVNKDLIKKHHMEDKKHHMEDKKHYMEDKKHHISNVHKAVLKKILEKVREKKDLDDKKLIANIPNSKKTASKKPASKKPASKKPASKKHASKKNVNNKTASKKNVNNVSASKKNVNNVSASKKTANNKSAKKPANNKSDSKKTLNNKKTIKTSNGSVHQVYKGKLGGHYYIKDNKKVYIKTNKDKY